MPPRDLGSARPSPGNVAVLSCSGLPVFVPRLLFFLFFPRSAGCRISYSRLPQGSASNATLEVVMEGLSVASGDEA